MKLLAPLRAKSNLSITLLLLISLLSLFSPQTTVTHANQEECIGDNDETCTSSSSSSSSSSTASNKDPPKEAPQVESSISYEEAAKITLEDISPDTRRFTPEELAEYTYKSDEDPTIYLAILGRVYEVTAGKEFYAPGEKYEFFAGRDASPCYATGDFTLDGMRVNIDELTDRQLKSIYDWFLFYQDHNTYDMVGVLAGGIFYDENAKRRGDLLQRIVDRVLALTSMDAEARIKKRQERLKRRAEKERKKKEREERLKKKKEREEKEGKEQ